MIFERIEATGLAHYSYIFGDEEDGVCAVIDPRRDVDVYLARAHHHSARITHILETHVHADFVSGSCELAARSGAPIHVGAKGDYGFAHVGLNEGDALQFGRLALEVLHTPGHTWEHVCFLVSGGAGAQAAWGLFSGDTLFAGEVGRPDIPGETEGKPLARALFRSLHDKVLPLGDELVIYPAHGEGSPCGASIGARRESTLGYERRHNSLLQIEDEDHFVEKLLASLPPVPSYYPRMKKVNADGPPVLGALPFLPPLDAGTFAAEMDQSHTLVLDTREIEAFGGAHIPGSLNIGLREPFPIWAGRILDETLPIWAGRILPPDYRLLLVTADEQSAAEARTELLRVGYDNVAGYLRKGMRGWTEAGKSFACTPQMSIHELKAHVEDGDELQILDVRSDAEWQEDHIPRAQHIHVPDLEENLAQLDRHRPIVTYCGSGYRASIAASILQRHGFEQVYNLPGSITAWKQAGYPLVTS